MPQYIENLVCTGCSLLCDDIVVELEGGKITKTHHVCARGYGRYFQVDFQYRLRNPILREGDIEKEITYEEALKEAVGLIKQANNPFFYGWASATIETQQKGIELAQKYNARIDCASTCSIGAAIQPLIQNKIRISKLSEIKDNADLLVFLGSNPTASHIRLLSRYALLARGANTDRGMEDRKAITIDIRKTDMSKFSEEFLEISPGKDKEVLEALIQIIEGKSISADIIAKISRKTLYEVANSMKEARFGTIFIGEGFGKTPENMAALSKLMLSLKQKGVEFGVVPLDGGYNAAGFCKILKEKAGMDLNADFNQPNYKQDKNLFLKSISSGEIDLLVILGADPISTYPFKICKRIAKIPMIVIDYQATPTTNLAKLVIPSTIPGVESEGTVIRFDLEPITLKKCLDPKEGIYSDEKILEDLIKFT
ncbi:MAG: formylmethanofuran dehydrogenase subunit B [Candidatus Helarchaeota archaeon]